MNILAGVNDYNNEIFKTSRDFESVTKGVDISKKFMSHKEFSKLNDNQEVDSNVLVGFVDTEGQGNRGDEFDIFLFSPILVTSKIVIFWWPEGFQPERILSMLGVMTNSARQISPETEDQYQNTKPYGHLHILFRSWVYNATSEQVKNKLLEQQYDAREEERNTIRRLLIDSFETINVWLFPENGPWQGQEKLLFNDFNDDWKQKFKEMHKTFSDQLCVNKPKYGAGRYFLSNENT